MTDTPPEIQKLYREMLMSRSGEERMQMGRAMFDAARSMVLASISKDLPPLERKRMLLKRLYGHELSPETLAKVSAALHE